MVRRSTVERSPQPHAYADYGQQTGDLAHAGREEERGPGSWRGAGGRWLVWVFRAVAWLVLLVIGYRGVTAIVFGETSSSSAPVATHRAGDVFPVMLARAYALQFGQVYLNANPVTSRERASQLAAFLPPGADPQLGWDRTGSLELQSEQVAGLRVRDSHRAVVTLLARVNGRLMELGVPIYASDGRLVVAGEPAWLPAPRRAAVPQSSPVSSDPATQSTLMRQLPAFFRAYASGNQVTLTRFLAPGTTVTGLAGSVVFDSLTGVTVPAGGRTRNALATVMWWVPGSPSPGNAGTGHVSPAGLEMTYALTIVKRDGAWYIKHIGSPTLNPGLP